MKTLAAVLLLASTTIASAQEVQDCNWQASARGLVEPWEDNTRVFANGAVRLALLDVTEPAAGAFYILVLSPPYAELGDRQCKVLGAGGGVGFSEVDFNQLAASYVPTIGLVFDVPVRVFNGASNVFVSKDLTFSLNQATGMIVAIYP